MLKTMNMLKIDLKRDEQVGKDSNVLDSVMAKGIVGEAGEKEINNRLY
jgi:hypothetical protein